MTFLDSHKTKHRLIFNFVISKALNGPEKCSILWDPLSITGVERSLSQKPGEIGIIRDGLIFLDLSLQGAGLQDTGRF